MKNIIIEIITIEKTIKLNVLNKVFFLYMDKIIKIINTNNLIKKVKIIIITPCYTKKRSI